ncbi:unnamed protein product [Paramecium pentaurelia]|uniref:EGF-like domain-containing protein n=1 Tax=Paramecium pentaurelia TaxID=43138 RepID=A0A8S1TV78_9CILI|nr:unnamed protein product [Paramecium pentaurelia]
MFKFVFRIYLILISCLLSLSCDQGQVENQGSCVDCPVNCLSCSVLLSCDTCMLGFYVTPLVYQCSACSINCQVCSGSSGFLCSTCFPKFYKSGSSCQACPTYCATCTSNSVCQTCVDHYFIIGTICSVCDTTCKTCLGTSSTCTSCDVGKYLSNSQCLPCISPCSACINNSNDCTSCININQIAVNFQCVCNDGYYFDGSNQCQLCEAPCSKCEDNSNNCTDCISTFSLSQYIQYKCECSDGYFQFDSQTCQRCISPCQTCEQNQNQCLSCVDSNQIVTKQNLCVCKTGWILNTDGISCIKCQLPCLDCVDTIDKCINCLDQLHQQPESCQCDSGWILDDNYFCIPCQQPCKTCEVSNTTKCLTCLDDNHELNNIQQCVCKSTYYSNSLITCAKCQEPCFECDADGCISCLVLDQIINLNHQCVCKPGFVLIGVHCVVSKCGDEIISEEEECDDGNLNPFDGCYECKFQCQEQCVNCNQGICYGCITTGWVLNENNVCTTQCGDGIVVDDYEQCDDGNEIPNDGCYQCQIQCPQGCIECISNKCIKCNYLYFLDIQTSECIELDQDIDLLTIKFEEYINLRCGQNQLIIDNACVSQCGNGKLINQYEECDDGNYYGGDGCSSFCQIENSFQCLNQENQISLCTFIKSPEFNLNILSNSGNYLQILELTFTQQVKLEEAVNFEDIIAFTITPQTKYKQTITSISDITIQLNYPQYQIAIEFIEPIENPVLQISIQKNTIYNQHKLGLLNNETKIYFVTPFVLPESTKQQLKNVVQLNDAMIYSMASVSSLALITGNTIIFFNLLDLLQSLSYLRFMQSQFPPHLRDFLNTYTKISLQPIFDYFQIDQLLNGFIGVNTSNQENNKLQQDQKKILEQPYLLNAKSCYFSVFGSILTYTIYCLLSSESLKNKIFKCFLKYKNNYKIVQIINKFQTKVQIKSLKQKIEYFSLGIFKVYLAILHQFMFSAILQFPNYKFDSVFAIFNSINAIFGLLIILISTLNLLSITAAKIKNKRKWKYFFQDTETKFWAIQFKSFQFYRILFYIFIIVEFINYPEAQSILLSIQSMLFLVYLIRFKPLKSLFELSKLILREFLLMIISGTFLVYSFEFSQDNFISIGWIHIGMFCTILAFNLLIDLFSQIKKTYDNYLQKKLKEKIEQEKNYHFNHLQGFQINKNDYQSKQ